MARDVISRREPDGQGESGRPAGLGPIDVELMRAAADELRDRTMSLEPPHAPTPWRFVTAVAVFVVVAVGLLFAYRQPLSVLLRQAGL